jgi:multiple sugar transport system permease protein
VFTLGTVPTGVVLALLSALLVDNRLKGIVLFRSALFMPVLSSWVVVAMIWRWLYNPQFGLINRILSVFGIVGPAWLSDLRWVMPAVIITTLWKFLGYNMIIYLAALQGVPDAYHEAASIDGANQWQRLWYITIPLLSPVTFFVTVVSLIGAFQAFPQFYMMTRGGPARCTNVIVYYIYENAFLWFKMGYASALAWVLFVLVFGLTMLQWKLQSRWVQYD